MSDNNMEITLSLGRLEGKMDMVLASSSVLADRLGRVTDAQTVHGERITALESRNTTLVTIVGIMVAMAAAAAAIFKDWFHL